MKYTILLIVLCFYSNLQAQLSGKITDSEGEPLAFASVYVEGTTTGTTSNIEGIYDLPLSKGNYNIVFQYVGFQQKVIPIEITNQPYQLDVKLLEESIALAEIVVKADAEDPAYAVIRKAIEKRTYYRDLIQAYACDTYVKGNQKLLDAPEKIMGQEIGDMGGSLDSNRQGIVYLSESQSRMYYQFPKKNKEIMISSKVSGDDNGFSFNRASMMNFSFYENTLDIVRPLVSPIASSALSYYKYQLVGTIYDEKNRLINKIEVIPKRENDPVFAGFIYIVEDTWNIQSTDLFATGKNIQQPLLDTLHLRQTNIPLKHDALEKWVVMSQVIEFQGGIFGFKLRGNFTGVFSNYDLSPTFEEGFFTNEVFIVEEASNQRDSSFWESARPIPLTQEESGDYVKKDSLQTVWKSKPYLDSLDQKNNKFKFINLLSGYSYNRSYAKKYFSIDSPVSAIQFNTIQGWVVNLDMDYRSELDDDGLRWYEIKPVLQYGLSDKKLRGKIDFRYNFNRTNFARLELSGGKYLEQFDASPPINGILNSLYTLAFGQNYLKAFDKTYGKIKYRQEIANGIFLRSSLEYAQKAPVFNTTDFTWADMPKFTSNNPQYPSTIDTPTSFSEYKSLIFDVHLRFRINQKFSSYPNRKFIEGSKWPDLNVYYRTALNGLGTQARFDLLRFKIQDTYMPTGRLGYFEFNAEFGIFLNRQNLQFPDYNHFRGNQTLFGNPERYNITFLRLPYYDFSTNNSFYQVHAEQHLEGFLLDKIPLLRKLGWQTVLGTSYLNVPDTSQNNRYLELNIGIDNIGFKAFRLLRFDIIFPFLNGNFQDVGFVIGLKV